MNQFEDILHHDLHEFLLSINEVDKHLPECPDLENKWEEIAQSYIQDGIREFNNYPTVSLGWMMYIGMAMAKYWDEEWEIYSNIKNIYEYMRDKKGYDNMDEYIRKDVLQTDNSEYDKLEKLTGECASRVYNVLRHQNIEPGTKEAFYAYLDCLHQLYLMGIAVELKRMGYHMTKIEQ